MTRSDSGPPGSSAGGISGSIAGDLEPCWLCGRSVAPRAPFCHACGAAQPPRPLDPFTRLGVERRFDLDLDQVARQHAGFRRAFDPERFAARGARQQANAKAQADALDEACQTLRDPVRRAHALLALLGGAAGTGAPPGNQPPGDPPADDEVAALAARLTAMTGDAAALDRIGLDISRRIEACVKYLAPAFRKAQADPAKAEGAARILAQLERLEALAAETSARRAGLTPAP